MPLFALLVTYYFAMSLEYLEMRRFALLFLMVWIVPILLAIFGAVVFELEEEMLYIASGSPLTMIVLSAQGLLNDWMNTEEVGYVRNSYWIGFVFILSVTAYLAYQLRHLKARTKAQIFGSPST